MDSVFKLIDRLLGSIPESVQRSIRLGMIGLWAVLGLAVGYIAYTKGRASVPQSGEDLYLSNIKEKVYRDRMKRDPSDVTLPDINELSKQETAPLSVYEPNEKAPESPDLGPEKAPLPLQGERDGIVFPEKGVRPELRSDSPSPSTSPEGRERPGTDRGDSLPLLPH